MEQLGEVSREVFGGTATSRHAGLLVRVLELTQAATAPGKRRSAVATARVASVAINVLNAVRKKFPEQPPKAVELIRHVTTEMTSIWIDVFVGHAAATRPGSPEGPETVSGASPSPGAGLGTSTSPSPSPSPRPRPSLEEHGVRADRVVVDHFAMGALALEALGACLRLAPTAVHELNALDTSKTRMATLVKACFTASWDRDHVITVLVLLVCTIRWPDSATIGVALRAAIATPEGFKLAQQYLAIPMFCESYADTHATDFWHEPVVQIKAANKRAMLHFHALSYARAAIVYLEDCTEARAAVPLEHTATSAPPPPVACDVSEME